MRNKYLIFTINIITIITCPIWYYFCTIYLVIKFRMEDKNYFINLKNNLLKKYWWE